MTYPYNDLDPFERERECARIHQNTRCYWADRARTFRHEMHEAERAGMQGLAAYMRSHAIAAQDYARVSHQMATGDAYRCEANPFTYTGD